MRPVQWGHSPGLGAETQLLLSADTVAVSGGGGGGSAHKTKLRPQSETSSSKPTTGRDKPPHTLCGLKVA